MQIEAEKRALLRWALIVVAGALALTLVGLGWMYQQYSSADSKVEAAEARATKAETEFKKVSQELAEKKAILDKQAATAAQQNTTLGNLVPKAVSSTASDAEIAALAHAIYEGRTGHAVEIPRVPPDKILKRYRYRVGAEAYSYVLVAGQVDGKWLLYSNLVGKGAAQTSSKPSPKPAPKRAPTPPGQQ
ncbi:MAG: hypothetical protein HY269_03420 [Deltaproteobacteria bacterium]|nr:hypothetical protein [Deltaproteobacteria bacterium]